MRKEHRAHKAICNQRESLREVNLRVVIAFEALRAVAARVSHDGLAAGVFLQVVCDVVHFSVDDDPQVLLRVVLGHFFFRKRPLRLGIFRFSFLVVISFLESPKRPTPVGRLDRAVEVQRCFEYKYTNGKPLF